MPRRHIVRHILNTLTGINLFGLIVGVLSRGRPVWDPRFGLIVFLGCRIGWPKSAAMTFGDIVVVRAQYWQSLEQIPFSLMEHEAAHARQYQFTLGLPYFPLYWVCCAYSWLKAGDYWSFNPFEVKAGLQKGGYLKNPSKWG